jgi:hypothetical protein
MKTCISPTNWSQWISNCFFNDTLDRSLKKNGVVFDERPDVFVIANLFQNWKNVVIVAGLAIPGSLK